MGFVLAGALAASGHIARGIYLSKGRSACAGYPSQKDSICQIQDIANTEFQSAISRNRGFDVPGNTIKQLSEEYAEEVFDAPLLKLIAKIGIETIGDLTRQIELIEKEVMSRVKLQPEFKYLLTIPGIGKILGLTIMLEVGDIGRFKEVGNYSSYCRCVKSTRLSNGKKKGAGNRKNGNRYLAWAYVEAAHFSTRYCLKAQSFYQRKKAKANGAVATKALANKLARASYYIMRDRVPFDEENLFK